jgi:hypothetical protein
VIASIIEGEVVDIYATVTDDMEVESVYLNYIVGSDAHSIVMDKVVGAQNRYRAALGPFPEGRIVKYYISAIDTSDNSAETPVVTLTVTKAPDTTPPIILNYTITTSVPERTKLILCATVIDDDSGVEAVYLNYTVAGVEYVTDMIIVEDANYTCTIGPFEPIGTIQYYIWAIDFAGNSNSTPLVIVDIIDIKVNINIEAELSGKPAPGKTIIVSGTIYVDSDNINLIVKLLLDNEYITDVTIDANLSFETVVMLPENLTIGEHTITITVTDTISNTTVTQDLTFKYTKAKKPTAVGFIPGFDIILAITSCILVLAMVYQHRRKRLPAA